MIPVIVRTTEEMLKLVPNELREASYALGVPKWRTIVRIVMPTALTGIITGIVLALARVMGETAPLLILVGYSPAMNFDLFRGFMASLPGMIKDQTSAGRRRQPDSHRSAVGRGPDADPAHRRLNLVARVVSQSLCTRKVRQDSSGQADRRQERQHLLRQVPRGRRRLADGRRAA